MIKILINPHGEAICHSFNHCPIVIGSGPNAHIHLDLSALTESHLKIIEDEEGYSILNCTNDPFVTINHKPFHKNRLNSGDLIQIYEIELKFEGQFTPVKVISKDEDLVVALDKKIIENSNFPQDDEDLKLQEYIDQAQFDLQDAEYDGIDEDELKELYAQVLPEIDNLDDISVPAKAPKDANYLFEVDWNGDAQLSGMGDILTEKTPDAPPLIPLAPEITPIKPINRGGLKEFHLSEQEEQKLLLQSIANSKAKPLKKRTWKWWLLILGILLTVIGTISIAAFIEISNETNIEELQAAQGVSDIAMALTHAQIYGLAPHNQNWSDSDFLKANLMSVLASKYPPATDIDNSRQLSCCSYSIRIYTSSDLSHFILIAQPSPSVFQWLIPKAAILVDSNFMELRKMKDLRLLNRLLANTDPLEGPNGLEIGSIIKMSELIRLSALAAETDHMEFSPPKALGWVRPAAENFIYNAPRYYKFGQPMMQKAIELSVAASNSQAVGLFKQEISALSDLKNLVLYCSQGKKSALQVRKGLNTFAPNQEFLVGYLTFNAKGLIASAQILREESHDNFPQEAGDLAISEKGVLASLNDGPHGESISHNDEELDGNDPLYIQLSSLARHRCNTLTPLSQKLAALITSHAEKPLPNFHERYQQLYDQYLEAIKAQDGKISQEMPRLCKEYSDIPASHLLIFAKATGLDPFLAHFSTAQTEKVLLPVEKEKFLNEIDQAQNLKELDARVSTAANIFTLEYIPNPTQLIADQNALRNRTITKLQQFLFSHDKHLKDDEFDVRNKDLLLDVMKHAWIVDPEERDFFISEWENLEGSG